MDLHTYSYFLFEVFNAMNVFEFRGMRFRSPGLPFVGHHHIVGVDGHCLLFAKPGSRPGRNGLYLVFFLLGFELVEPSFVVQGRALPTRSSQALDFDAPPMHLVIE